MTAGPQRGELPIASPEHLARLALARIIALTPLLAIALTSSDLIQQGRYVLLVQQASAAAAVSVLIAVTYRVVDWLMSAR